MTCIFSLAGAYIASQNKMPDVDVQLKVREGYIAHAKAPIPVDKIHLNLESHIPSFNADSLWLKIDSLHFTLGKNFLDGRMRVKGINQPYVFADLKSELDLEALDRALGLQD